MPALSNYGQAIASTTIALQGLLASMPADLQVTARTPNAARIGVAGASVNVFLFGDGVVSYREASALHGPGRMIAELHYLVSAYPGDDADTDAVSQRAYGTARAAVERHPVLAVPVGSAESMQVRLASSVLPMGDLSALWRACGAPLRLSFAVTASFTLDDSERFAVVGTIRDVVTRAGVGTIAVFSGVDTEAKAAAAAFVAKQLGRPLLRATLGEIVSKYIVETEANLSRLFDRAERGGAVLLIEEADALFGARPAVTGGLGRYTEVEVGPMLDQFARAPGVVIIAVGESVDAELADRAQVEVRFPPGER